MTHPARPDLASLSDADRLSALLWQLFEPTEVLRSHLVPALLLRLSAAPTCPTYNQLIDMCAEIGDSWDWDTKARFIQGHPMIGEVKLSGHSEKEQGKVGERQVVLDR